MLYKNFEGFEFGLDLLILYYHLSNNPFSVTNYPFYVNTKLIVGLFSQNNNFIRIISGKAKTFKNLFLMMVPF